MKREVAAWSFVGVPALNPLTTSSRMFGCTGIARETFIAVYWLCPVIGWMAAAVLERRLRASTATDTSKKTEVKKKN